MRTFRTLLATLALLGGALTMNAQRMSLVAMRGNARFLTDRMAYTLGISDPYLIDEMYRINYDYIYGVNDYLDDVALGYYYDDYMAVCAARDRALSGLLGVSLWNRVVGYSYFYRPIAFANRGWRFAVYDYDRWGARHFFYDAPRPYAGGYTGGHFFRGMTPRGGRVQGPVPGVAPRGGRVTATERVNRRDGLMGGQRGGGQQGNMGQPQGNAGQPQGNAGQQGNTGQSQGSVNQGNTNPGTSQGNAGRSEGNVRSSSRSGGGTSRGNAGMTTSGVSRSAGTTTRSSATRSAGTTTRSSATRSGAGARSGAGRR